MVVHLKNNKEVLIRFLQPSDSYLLFQYFENLSQLSRSRFGPHPFDRNTVKAICQIPSPGFTRYIAIDELTRTIVSYMLIKQGMIEEDQLRYSANHLYYNHNNTVTYAPSVADEWQNSGLGSRMFELILAELKTNSIRHVILWGGVQESNEIAVHFYRKSGFLLLGAFWHDNKNNLDMVLNL